MYLSYVCLQKIPLSHIAFQIHFGIVLKLSRIFDFYKALKKSGMISIYKFMLDEFAPGNRNKRKENGDGLAWESQSHCFADEFGSTTVKEIAEQCRQLYLNLKNE